MPSFFRSRIASMKYKKLQRVAGRWHWRAGCVAVALSFSCLQPSIAQQLTQVIVEQVRLDDFQDRVEALGTLKANESVELTAKVTDRVVAIDFVSGQEVRKGDVLVRMTNDEQGALLEEARSTRDEAKEQYDRVRPLAERGYATGAQLDERKREHETAKARYLAMQIRMDDRLVIAPFDGVVGLRNISVGALVGPGTVITTLNDLSKMKLDFSVPATFLTALRPGLPLKARSTALGDQVFEGFVSSLDNQINPITRSIKVRALIDNPERLLRPGLLMSVELEKDPRQTLVISEEALVRRAGQSYVFVVVAAPEGGEMVEQRRVQIGSRRAGEVEVLSGLEQGDFVITHGTIKVRPGQRVTIAAEQASDVEVRDMIRKKSST